MSIYGRTRRKFPLYLKSWNRIEIHHGPSKDGKVRIFEHQTVWAIFSFKRLITVDVNGKTVMSADVREVTGILRLFTSPSNGPPPADGVIRAVTIITNENYFNTNSTFFGHF